MNVQLYSGLTTFVVTTTAPVVVFTVLHRSRGTAIEELLENGDAIALTSLYVQLSSCYTAAATLILFGYFLRDPKGRTIDRILTSVSFWWGLGLVFKIAILTDPDSELLTQYRVENPRDFQMPPINWITICRFVSGVLGALVAIRAWIEARRSGHPAPAESVNVR